MMPDFGLSSQHLAQDLPSRVVRPVSLRDGPLHDGADVLPHSTRSFGLPMPDRIQDSQNVRTGDVINVTGADVGKNIASQQVPPLSLHVWCSSILSDEQRWVLFFSLFQWILPNYSMNSSGRCSNWFTTAGENWGRVKAL